MNRHPRRHYRGTPGIRQTGSLLFILAVGFPIGCGTPGAPLAPTLKLPQPVQDLSAARSGDTVHLKWTMPRRSTDKILLEGKQGAHICRKQAGGDCEPVGDLSLDPGVPGEFADQLPPQLQTGSPRPILYTVELRNHAGHSAGLSNQAYSAAGTAPLAVAALSAEVTSEGVQLHWRAADAAGASAVLRIHRKLLMPAPGKNSSSLGSAPETATMTLLVAPPDGKDRGEALDRSTVFGRRYEYWIERLARIDANGHSIEIESLPGKTIQVETKDVFPPKAPGQLVAVAVDAQGAIDLSWSPNVEPDLAGYIVYRSEADGRPGRVSPKDAPVAAPSFRDTSVERGHRYRYSVTAVDTNGNESPRSVEAEEALPQ